jgi:hypothetical protein
MAEQQGGYRRPSSPAPVSGPGALSQRTDGQGAKYMAGGEYGEGQEMMDLQTSAPMSKAPEQQRMRQPRSGRQVVEEGMRPTPLFAPTERPDEPITAGAPFGPGLGPSTMTQPMVRPGVVSTRLYQLAPSDATGELRRYADILAARGL